MSHLDGIRCIYNFNNLHKFFHHRGIINIKTMYDTFTRGVNYNEWCHNHTNFNVKILNSFNQELKSLIKLLLSGDVYVKKLGGGHFFS